jgi:hypothetical protein
VLDSPASKIDGVLQLIQCYFLSLEWSYLTQKRIFSYVKNRKGRQEFLQNITQCSQGNIVLNYSASMIGGFLREKQWFFLSLEWSYLAQRWSSSHVKALRGRHYSCHKLTQFSKGNNMLDSPASKIDHFLTREKVLHRLTWMELFSQCWCSLPLKTLRRRQYSFQKVTEFSKGNMVLNLLDLNIYIFLTREIVIPPFTWIKLFHSMVMFLTVENTERWAVFLSKGNWVVIQKRCARHSCFKHIVLFHQMYAFLHFIWRECFS